MALPGEGPEVAIREGSPKVQYRPKHTGHCKKKKQQVSNAVGLCSKRSCMLCEWQTLTGGAAQALWSPERRKESAGARH